jgi:hypothetical protein
LFGTALIGYWPLWEASGATAYDQSGNGRDGTYTGVDLGQAGIGDLRTSPYFDGANDYVDIYTAGLSGAFNPAAGSLFLWLKLPSGAWSDGLTRYCAYIAKDTNNCINIGKSLANNSLFVNYKRAGTNHAITRNVGAIASFLILGMTWDTVADQLKFYINGVQDGGTLGSLGGAWSTPLASTLTLLGASAKTPAYVFLGNMAHAVLLNRVATPAEAVVASVAL